MKQSSWKEGNKNLKIEAKCHCKNLPHLEVNNA